MMFLPLAERMTKKYITEGKVEAEAGRTEFFCVVCVWVGGGSSEGSSHPFNEEK